MQNGIPLADGTAVNDVRLDRLVQFDERSREYPIRTMLAAAKIKKPRSYTWRVLDQLDQKREGACAGFCVAHELIARPAEVLGIGNEQARAIYKLAQKIDPWPGEDYEGTSILAAVKAAQRLYPGKVPTYRWCFGLEDLIMTVGYFGPVVAGTNWYRGMSHPDAGGVIRVTGPVDGGHGYLYTGVDLRFRRFRIRNNWSSAWGRNGDAFISFEDTERLLHERGELVIFVNREPEKRRKVNPS